MAGAIDIAEMKDKLAAQALAVVEHLLPAGRRDGREWKVGSVYGEPGNSLSVCVAGPKAGTWSDFAAGDRNGGRSLIDLWMAAHQVDLATALTEIREYLGIVDDRRDRHELSRRRDNPETSRRREVLPSPPHERIATILRRATALKGTMAEFYLRHRQLEPDLVDPLALRFLPALGTFAPTMVAVVTDFTDATNITGLQFTPLLDFGRARGGRKFLTGSRAAGGVVRLVEDSEVTHELGISEGTETGLAVMTAMKLAGRAVLPVWSAMSAGNLANLPVVPGIERLSIFADRDESGVGQQAAERLAERWHQAGREVLIATPPHGDWNEGVQ